MAEGLFDASSNALVKRFCTMERYNRLRELTTPSGFTLDRAIRSGRDHPDSHIGIYAGDADCYTLFSDIFRPVIRAYHQIEGPIHHATNRIPLDLPDLDPDGRFIRSSRVRTARNMAGWAFPPGIARADRRAGAAIIQAALADLPHPFRGTYHPMDTLDKDEIDTRVMRHHAFPPGDRFQESAGINRNYPESRGVHVSHDGCAVIWVNEEDQLRIISLEPSGHIGKAFHRFTTLVQWLDTRFTWARDPDLGFLNACPSNIGTAMRAGVHIRLPKLQKQMPRLTALARAHHLQIRGTRGENTRVSEGIFDVSNQRRLGISEHRIIQDLHSGLLEIIHTETRL